MTPDEIKRVFGEHSLNMLYDAILNRAVHELADWILMYQSETDIARWIFTLKNDALDEGEIK